MAEKIETADVPSATTINWPMAIWAGVIGGAALVPEISIDLFHKSLFRVVRVNARLSFASQRRPPASGHPPAPTPNFLIASA